MKMRIKKNYKKEKYFNKIFLRTNIKINKFKRYGIKFRIITK